MRGESDGWRDEGKQKVCITGEQLVSGMSAKVSSKAQGLRTELKAGGHL